MKRFSWFVLGSAFGAWTMALLAQYASTNFLDVVKANLRDELASMAQCSKEQGRMDDAAAQYAFMLDADSSSMWDRARDAWTLEFPLVAPIRENMRDSSNDRGFGAERGLRKAMLGDALERAGRLDEAQLEYSAALRLLHLKEESGLRRLIDSQAGVEKAMLSERERHGEDPCLRAARTARQ